MANVLVSGAGTEACNGLYIGSGSGQDAVYTKSGYEIYWFSGANFWVIADSSHANLYYSDDGMGNTNPWDSSSWSVIMMGEEPPPTVTEVSGFSISGTVELADESPVETVKLTATASGEDDVVTYTDENGDYTLENLKDETTWRVTPTKLACTFSPTYLDVALSGANQSGKDFTATLTGHDVSGTVADAGTGVAGATVSATDGVNVVEAETDEYGAYTLENLPDDEWEITVAAGDRVVFPASRTVTVSGANLTQVNFVAVVRGHCVLLLHLNTDFTDSSPSGHTVSVHGDAAISTDQKKFGAGSCVLDGTGDYLSVPDAGDWDLGDFTVDAWIRPDTITSCQRIAGAGSWAHGPAAMWFFGIGTVWGGGTKLNFGYGWGPGYTEVNSNAISVATETWYHVAVVRSGATLYFFLNGTAVGSGNLGSTKIRSGSGPLIGARYESSSVVEVFDGYIDELRISKLARWTEDFTPETSEYEPDAEIYVIEGTILDGSSNPVPGVLVTATASGESDVTAYTGPDGKYAIGGLTDNTTWRLTPTKTDWTFTPTYEDVEVSGADETGVDFEGEEAGGEGREVTTTRAISLSAASALAGTRTANLSASTESTETRAAQLWSQETLEALRAAESFVAEALAGTRPGEAGGGGLLTALRTLAAFVEETLTGTRSAEALALDDIQQARSLEAWAEEVLAKTQSLELIGAEEAAGLRQAEVPAEQSLAETREGASWGAERRELTLSLEALASEVLAGTRPGEGWAEEPIDGSRTAEALGEVGAATERVLKAFAQHVLGCEQAGTVWGAVLAGETWAAETWAEAIEAAARTAELYSGDTQVGVRAARAFAISLLSSARTLALFGEEALEGSRTGELLGAGLLTTERIAELWAEALEELATLRSLEMWAGAHLIGTREAQGWAQVEEALSRGVLCAASARLAVTGTGEMWAAGEEVASRALYLSAEDSVAALREIALTGSSLPETQRAAFLLSLVGQQILYEGEAWGFEEQVGTRALLLSGAHPASGTRQCFFWAGGAVRGRRMNPHVMPGMHPGLFGGGG